MTCSLHVRRVLPASDRACVNIFTMDNREALVSSSRLPCAKEGIIMPIYEVPPERTF